MKRVILLTLVIISQITFGQILEFEPRSIDKLDLSATGEKKFNDEYKQAEKILEKIENGLDYNDLSAKEKQVYDNIDETIESYWDVIGGGCSWYCGGGPKKIIASSFLKSQGNTNYKPENAHDLNYKTAWVEGVLGYGIGEYLVYSFGAGSPRITDIIVVNGYVKSAKAWKENSRVKKLKLYINNKPFAILKLKDIRGAQLFKFDPIGGTSVKDWEKIKLLPDWTMKFEIIEVYKGDKYDDVVISEIYFDGIDVHCFSAGTKVLMGDKSSKNIEDLVVGDVVSYMDFDSNSLKSAKIEKLEKIVHNELVVYQFESGLKITATPDHPFKIKNKGWASLLPEKSTQYEGFENCSRISIDDEFLTPKGYEKLVSISYSDRVQQTYTISKLSSGMNFIANGLIVAVESLK